MDRISTKIAEHKLNDTGFISLEFFPPKTESGLKNLYNRIQRLSILNPLFVNVTWGAGGSTSKRSLELASYCQNALGLTTCLHLTCTNSSVATIDEALASAKNAGIRNILALRGDPPRNEVLESENSPFKYAVDLVKYIRREHGDYFDIGVAAYPDGHVDGSDISNQDFKKDLPYLMEKVEAGANFIITQLFFDVDQYLEFESTVQSIKQLSSIPIIPGLIPINNYQLLHRVSKLSHAKIPTSLLSRFLPEIQNDDRKVKEIGVEVLCDIINEVYAKSKSKVKGFHFYSLNLESSIAMLVKQSEILQKYTRFESNDEKEQTPDEAFSRREILAISTGVGTLGKEATWDEFPNGRFGDSRSPAYGEIDGYGPSLKIPTGFSDPTSKELWGAPQNLDDIAEIFSNFLAKKIPAIPFSDLEISPESLLIQEELLNIITKHWFSLSSQPAINGYKSNDPIFGWGAHNGYIYQKAYIELLLPKDEWETVLKPKVRCFNENSCSEESGVQSLSYYTKSFEGEVETNICVKNRVSAVTWGVFPNKEIIQPTVIEEQSFKAWSDEVYKVLSEWANLYFVQWKNGMNNSEEHKNSYNLLKEIHGSFQLVTLFSNNFQKEDDLWEFLLNI